jgi:hypothetical protein
VCHKPSVLEDEAKDQAQQSSDRESSNQRSNVTADSNKLTPNEPIHLSPHTGSGHANISDTIEFHAVFNTLRVLCHKEPSIFERLLVVALDNVHNVVSRIEVQRDWKLMGFEITVDFANGSLVNYATSLEENAHIEQLKDIRRRLVDGTQDSATRCSDFAKQIYALERRETVESCV